MGDFSGELKEVIQLVEEVMRRMREIYGADREIGDMSLGSITQFVYRKLRCGCGRVIGLGMMEWRCYKEGRLIRSYSCCYMTSGIRAISDIRRDSSPQLPSQHHAN